MNLFNLDGQNKWTKILTLEITIFGLKMMKKSGLEKNYFKIPRAPSEKPANQPGQFSLSGQIFFALGISNSEGARGISKQFFLDYFSPSFLSQKCFFQEVRF
jgi:hypothetical protein